MKIQWQAGIDRRLEDAWRELSNAAGAGPFHRPEWHAARGRTWNRPAERLLTAWQGDELLAVWPIIRSGGHIAAAGAMIADYLSPLVRPGMLEIVSEAFARELAGAAPRIDLARLEPELRPRRWQALLAEQGLQVRRIRQETCPALGLAGGFAAVERGLRPGLRRAYRYAERRLARQGALHAGFVGEGEVARALSRLVRWHQDRFRARGTPGSFFGGRGAFHQELARAFAAAGVLRLASLTLDSRPIAHLYAFRGGDRFYYYAAGFDPQWALYSPGLVLLKESIRLAAEEGAKEFDFLRGEETYKQPWTTHVRHLERIVAARPGHRYYLAVAAAEERLGAWVRHALGRGFQ